MTKDFNIKLIIRVIGSLLLIESILILSTSAISFIYDENDWIYFVGSGLVCILFGILAFLFGRKAPKIIGKREGSVIVTLVWVIFSLAGMMPFWLSGSIPSFTDAFFETMSGFTTTGATILNDIESLSYGMLYWRSFTQWIGGLGIIVISLALLPVLGFSGVQLFGAESTGPTKEKIHPKITGTAKRLFFIYLWLTIAEFFLLKLGGMDWFDALCHSFSTISTGGFSTKQASIAYWDSPFIHYVIMVFMLFSGVNFVLYYFLFKRRWDKIKKNEELRYYMLLVLIFSIAVGISLIDFSHSINFRNIELAFRESFFQVIAVMTSTGFATADYLQWKSFAWVILIFTMLIGASAGSTSGGLKIVRVVIVFKYCYYEFKRMVHPNAIIPITYSGEIVKSDVVTRILSFIILYFALIAVGVLVLTMSGVSFSDSASGVIACLGCIGPAFGSLGPMDNYHALAPFAKWFLSFLMLVGRLELFTILLLFTPVFWRK